MRQQQKISIIFTRMIRTIIHIVISVYIIITMTKNSVTLPSTVNAESSCTSSSSRQCSISPSQQQQQKYGTKINYKIGSNDNKKYNSLIALNVVQPQQEQQYYKDDDFVIPSINSIKRSELLHQVVPKKFQFMNHMLSSPNNNNNNNINSYFTTASTTAAPVADFMIIVYVIASFSKVIINKIVHPNRPKNTFISTISKIFLGKQQQPSSATASITTDVTVDDNNNVTSDSAAVITIEEWKQMYEQIQSEVTNLRLQLLDLTQKLEYEQQQKIETIKDKMKVENESVTTQTIQELNNTIEHWKAIAQSKDEEMEDRINIERQTGIQQMEQLKQQMIQVVDQERQNMYTEFATMVQQLRENLNLITSSSSSTTISSDEQNNNNNTSATSSTSIK